MALIQCGFYSDILQKNTTVHLVLPSPAPDDLLFGRDTKTLYADAGGRARGSGLPHA